MTRALPRLALPLLLGGATGALAQAGEDGPGLALDAEARGDWAAALDAWTRCAATGSGSDARLCRTRAELLAPQAADAFAGWTALEAVRREYRALGSDAALARVQAALAAHPDSPAAPEMRLWLVNEHTRRGEEAEAAALRERVAADAALPAPAREWVRATAETREADRRRAWIGGAGGAVAALYAGVALRGPGPWRARSALAAAGLVGVVPVVMAAGYEAAYAEGFVHTGVVVSLAVLAAARAPLLVSVPGTLGGLLAAAWWNDWLPSLGL